MKRLRIFPEICASTRCSFLSATRNIVPGSTLMIVPSSSIAFSEFIRFLPQRMRRRSSDRMHRIVRMDLVHLVNFVETSVPSVAIFLHFTDDYSQTSADRRRRDADVPREDVLH